MGYFYILLEKMLNCKAVILRFENNDPCLGLAYSNICVSIYVLQVVWALLHIFQALQP